MSCWREEKVNAGRKSRMGALSYVGKNGANHRHRRSGEAPVAANGRTIGKWWCAWPEAAPVASCIYSETDSKSASGSESGMAGGKRQPRRTPSISMAPSSAGRQTGIPMVVRSRINIEASSIDALYNMPLRGVARENINILCRNQMRRARGDILLKPTLRLFIAPSA